MLTSPTQRLFVANRRRFASLTSTFDKPISPIDLPPIDSGGHRQRIQTGSFDVTSFKSCTRFRDAVVYPEELVDSLVDDTTSTPRLELLRSRAGNHAASFISSTLPSQAFNPVNPIGSHGVSWDALDELFVEFLDERNTRAKEWKEMEEDIWQKADQQVRAAKRSSGKAGEPPIGNPVDSTENNPSSEILTSQYHPKTEARFKRERIRLVEQWTRDFMAPYSHDRIRSILTDHVKTRIAEREANEMLMARYRKDTGGANRGAPSEKDYE